MFTFVTIELSTGEYLIENGLHTALAPSAMIGASGYFFGRKVEGGELGEDYREQLAEKEEELMQAKKKIAAYKRMLMRYRYNANRLGIDPTSLEAPIPPQNADGKSRS